MSTTAKKRPKTVPASPKMRKFIVRIEGEIEIEVADELLKSCNTDEWREQMMAFTRDEEFVEHIAYNMVMNGLKLESIDGYADQPPERVKVTSGYAWDWLQGAEEVKS